MKNLKQKEEVSRTARLFFGSLGMSGWFMMILMLVSVSSAPPLYQAYRNIGLAQGEHHPLGGILYWRILTSTIVYVSLLVYFFYLMNYTRRSFSIPLLVLHGLNAIISVVCMSYVTWENIGQLSSAFQSDYWSRLVGGIISSSLIVLFLIIRLSRETPKKVALQSGNEQVETTKINTENGII